MISMQWQVLYIISIIVAVFVLLTLLSYAMRLRYVSGASYFVGFVLSALLWTLTIGVMALLRPETGYIWLNIKYVWIATTPVTLFMFALHYTSREVWLTKRFIAALFIIPFITQIVVWTNPQHGLMIRDLQFAQTGILTYIPPVTFGPYYWIHTGYGYGLTLLSLLLVVITLLRGAYLYRWQGVLLAAGILSPLLTNVLLITGITPREIDPMPFGLLVSTVLLWGSVFRYHLLDLAPVARNVFVDMMPNGMLAVDDEGRIIDINKSMLEMIGAQPTQVIGLPITRVLQQWQDLVKSFIDQTDVQTEISIGLRQFDLLIKPLADRRGTRRGRLVVLHEITSRKVLEKEREDLIVTLQQALSEVKRLSGLLPICANCKKIRDDQGYWQDVAVYIRDHSEAEFTHGICPDCVEVLYPGVSRRRKSQDPG